MYANGKKKSELKNLASYVRAYDTNNSVVWNYVKSMHGRVYYLPIYSFSLCSSNNFSIKII